MAASLTPIIKNLLTSAKKKTKKDKQALLKPKIRVGITYKELNDHFTATELRDYFKDQVDNKAKVSALKKPELIEKVLESLQPQTTETLFTSPLLSMIKNKKMNAEVLRSDLQYISTQVDKLERVDASDSEESDIEMTDLTRSTSSLFSQAPITKDSQSNLYSRFYELGLRNLESLKSFCEEHGLNTMGSRETLKRRIMLHLSKHPKDY